jgi:hypothetical protein
MLQPTTGYLLRTAADLITTHGLWRGEQLAGPNGELDLSAAIHVAATGTVPQAFRDDEATALDLIANDPEVMAAIRHLSATIDHLGGVAPGPRPDYVEHVSQWAMTPAPRDTCPPTESEVIGRLLRAANQADEYTAANSIAA